MKLSVLFGILLSAVSLQAQTSAFTYQGKLNDNGTPANGIYDFRFQLFDAETNGGYIAAIMVRPNTVVSNGLFTVRLEWDPSVFNGSPRWMQIGVRTNGDTGFHTQLNPRQQITSAPYAIRAANADFANTAISVQNGVYTSGNQTFSGINNFSNPFNTFAGSFSGDGGNLTNVLANNLIRVDEEVVAWGNNWVGETNVPLNLKNVVSIEAGESYSLALLNDGTIRGWGDNSWGQLNIPANLTNAVAVAAGSIGAVALKSDGTVAHWGEWFGHSPPAGLSNVVAIDMGFYECLALKSDGTIARWGQVSGTMMPAGLSNVVAVSSGGYRDAALLADGTVVIWGSNVYTGEITVRYISSTNSLAIAISQGHGHTLILRQDKSVQVIGAAYAGTLPAVITNVIAVEAGQGHSALLYADGTVFSSAFPTPPGLRDVVAISAGRGHLMALRREAASAFASYLDEDQIFTGVNWLTNSGNKFAGDGSGLTALDASQITSGTLANPRLSASVSLLGQSIESGEITSLDASKIASGTLSDARFSANVPLLSGGKLSDANLSSNVALLSAGRLPAANLPTSVALLSSSQTFTGNNTIQTAGVGLPLRITDGNLGNIVVQTLGGGNSGFQTINFNGYYTGAEVTYNTNKTRWRVGVDQRSGADSFFVDSIAKGVSLRIYTNGNVEMPLGNLTVGGSVTATAFNPTSDRNAKENFTFLDSREVLEKVAALPISKWNFKGDGTTKHVGPMAQDFHAAFGLGADDKHIATVDADGVALAAIQGLNQKLEADRAKLEKQNAALQKRNEDLEQRLSHLEQLVRKIAEPK